MRLPSTEPAGTAGSRLAPWFQSDWEITFGLEHCALLAATSVPVADVEPVLAALDWVDPPSLLLPHPTRSASSSRGMARDVRRRNIVDPRSRRDPQISGFSTVTAAP